MAESNRSKRVPKYRRQRRPDGTDLAFVELSGRRVYLGAYGTPESRQAYERAVAEWNAGGRHPAVATAEITVAELLARWWTHADGVYRSADGTKTSTPHCYRSALRPVRSLYGRARVSEFTPLALKACREKFIEGGWNRRTVNQGVNLIRAVFRWAVSEEIVPVAVLQALTTVEALKPRRSSAPEPKRVRPVPQEHVEAIRQHVGRPVWALVTLQRYTGARGGELLIMRPMDVDMTGDVWAYTPTRHKTEAYGHGRTIWIGPRGQDAIREFIVGRATDAYLFDPREAVRERAASAPTHRRPNQIENPRMTGRVVGDHYTADSYRRAIERACEAAGVPVWTPHRLRHLAATELRREYGIDVAQCILGHALGSAITEVYAEANVGKAKAAIAAAG